MVDHQKALDQLKEMKREGAKLQLTLDPGGAMVLLDALQIALCYRLLSPENKKQIIDCANKIVADFFGVGSPVFSLVASEMDRPWPIDVERLTPGCN